MIIILILYERKKSFHKYVNKRQETIVGLAREVTDLGRQERQRGYGKVGNERVQREGMFSCIDRLSCAQPLLLFSYAPWLSLPLSSLLRASAFCPFGVPGPRATTKSTRRSPRRHYGTVNVTLKTTTRRLSSTFDNNLSILSS